MRPHLLLVATLFLLAGCAISAPGLKPAPLDGIRESRTLLVRWSGPGADGSVWACYMNRDFPGLLECVSFGRLLAGMTREELEELILQAEDER
jgi:hypothetical protein